MAAKISADLADARRAGKLIATFEMGSGGPGHAQRCQLPLTMFRPLASAFFAGHERGGLAVVRDSCFVGRPDRQKRRASRSQRGNVFACLAQRVAKRRGATRPLPCRLPGVVAGRPRGDRECVDRVRPGQRRAEGHNSARPEGRLFALGDRASAAGTQGPGGPRPARPPVAGHAPSSPANADQLRRGAMAC